METFTEFLNRMIWASFCLHVNVLDLNHTIVFWTPRSDGDWEMWQE